MSKADKFREQNLDEDFRSRTELSIAENNPSTADHHAGRRRYRNAAVIELSSIVANEQVRKKFADDEIKKLAHSLKTKGQIQPIVVRWDESKSKYVIIAGECRYRAAKLNGDTEINCIVNDGQLSDEEVHELQLIENIIRQELNPIDEAKAFRKIMSDRDCTGKDLAAELGLDATTVNRSVRLLTLADDIQKDIADGRLPKSVVREVLKLKGEETQREMIQSYYDGHSYSDVASQVQKQKTGKASLGTKTKKTFTSDGIQIQATSKKRITKAQIAQTLKLWLDELESDGRSQTQKTAA